jgi:hypothetical protein
VTEVQPGMSQQIADSGNIDELKKQKNKLQEETEDFDF